MNKKHWILVIIIIVVLIGGGVWFYFSNKNKVKNDENNYEANRTSTDNQDQAAKDSSTEGNKNKQETPLPQEEQNPQYKEEELATFSTKIYSKDSSRQNNIGITCNALNGHIVKKGETFSFCNTVGQATTSKGYQKADIYDQNGKKKKGLRWWKLSSK